MIMCLGSSWCFSSWICEKIWMEFPKTFGGFLKNCLNKLMETPMHFSYPLGPFFVAAGILKKNSKKETVPKQNSEKNLVHFWCTFDALLMQFWCSFDALLMQFWCTFDALLTLLMHFWKVHQKCIKIAKKCIKSASKVHHLKKVHQKCIKSASKVHHFFPQNFALELFLFWSFS